MRVENFLNIFFAFYFSSLIIVITFNRNNRAEDSIRTVQTVDETRKLLFMKCWMEYSLNCFLMDICNFIDKLSSKNIYQILPGIYFEKNKTIDRFPESSVRIFEKAIANNQTDVSAMHTLEKLYLFLNSWELTFKKNISERFLQEFSTELIHGRSKKKYGIMWIAGAIAALGSSTLFVITGKAAIASLAALIISMVSFFRGSSLAAYTSSNALSAPNKRDCPSSETIIDVNGREYNTIHKKLSNENNWTHSKYNNISNSNDYNNEYYYQ